MNTIEKLSIEAVANLTACAAPTAPGAPTGATATAGVLSATVSWTAPASTGGSPITSYKITPYIGLGFVQVAVILIMATLKTNVRSFYQRSLPFL